MNNTIRIDTKKVYITSNRAHNTADSAENEIIEQNIRERMTNIYNYTPLEISHCFKFILENKILIKTVLNTPIHYE
jgi:hypothetical protein